MESIPSSRPRIGQLGASAAEDVRDVARSDAVVTMLSDDDAVRSIIFDKGPTASGYDRYGAYRHEHTFGVVCPRTREIAWRCRIGYVAAPVMGRPDAAASGRLHVLAAGDSHAIERVRPILDAMGQRIWLLGAAPHRANVVKLAGSDAARTATAFSL